MLDPDLLLPNRIARFGRDDPHRPFIEEVSGRACTYGELYDLGLRWAAGLRRLGVGAGNRVLTMMPSRISWMGCWMGLSNIAAADVGVNTAFRREFLASAIRRARGGVMLIAAEYLDALPADIAADSDLHTLIVDGAIDDFGRSGLRVLAMDDVLGERMDPRDTLPVQPWDTAAIVMTSGTTGPSKYVITPWGEHHNGAYGSIPIDDLTAEDIWYQPLPIYHLAGRFAIVAMALAGGRCIFRDSFSLSAFWPEVRRYGCTLTSVSPFARLLWDQPARDDDSDNPLRAVNFNPVYPWYRDFAERFGVRLCVSYGSSELGVPFGGYYDPAAAGICGSPRAGYPGIEMRIVDDHDHEVPTGVVGELIVRAAEPWSFFTGYFDDSAATAAAWRNGWYHTGDAVQLGTDGLLRIVDRLKDTLRRRNENISSFEVEAIVNRHPAVLESAAIGIPQPGEEDELKVVAVLREGVSIAPAQFVAELAQDLPKFMVPRYVEFVDALPKTPATGRVQKVDLRARGITPQTWDREAAVKRG